MPAAVVQTSMQALAPRLSKAVPQISPNMPTSVFEPSKHLLYSKPSRILTMNDLGLETTLISHIAASDPFPLLSYEAVLEHRRELFSPKVVDNCLHQTLPGSAMLRGMAQRYTPFIHAFWNSPEILKIVSDIAGVDLVPALNYEICHTNIQLGAEGLDGVKATPVVPPEAIVKTSAKSESQQQRFSSENNGYDDAIVKWHKDSHPFVCVVMLSDARNMEGGETVLMGGDGKTIPVRAPQMGSAVVLQGRHINHVALPVTNMPERITIVTSFRPRDPTLLDETTHLNIRYVSQLSELFYQWTTYRLDNLAKRASIISNKLKEEYAQNVKKSDDEAKAGMCRVETVNYEDMKKWAEEQINYLQQTIYEMRPLEED
ncbi:Fc.00g000140.m01.CDS01 [Cosmosporella sp. VM-42]